MYPPTQEPAAILGNFHSDMNKFISEYRAWVVKELMEILIDYLPNLARTNSKGLIELGGVGSKYYLTPKGEIIEVDGREASLITIEALVTKLEANTILTSLSSVVSRASRAHLSVSDRAILSKRLGVLKDKFSRVSLKDDI